KPVILKVPFNFTIVKRVRKPIWRYFWPHKTSIHTFTSISHTHSEHTKTTIHYTSKSPRLTTSKFIPSPPFTSEMIQESSFTMIYQETLLTGVSESFLGLESTFLSEAKETGNKTLLLLNFFKKNISITETSTYQKEQIETQTTFATESQASYELPPSFVEYSTAESTINKYTESLTVEPETTFVSESTIVSTSLFEPVSSLLSLESTIEVDSSSAWEYLESVTIASSESGIFGGIASMSALESKLDTVSEVWNPLESSKPSNEVWESTLYELPSAYVVSSTYDASITYDVSDTYYVESIAISTYDSSSIHDSSPTFESASYHESSIYDDTSSYDASSYDASSYDASSYDASSYDASSSYDVSTSYDESITYDSATVSATMA
ncbi:hypothetical protein HK096_007692, partial [Nowakowskiella sp. JEL0078]